MSGEALEKEGTDGTRYTEGGTAKVARRSASVGLQRQGTATDRQPRGSLDGGGRDRAHQAGQTGPRVFLLLKGAARCLVDGTLAATFEAGDFFGEMALLDHGPRVATVIADGPAEVLVLYGSEFSDLLSASPSIAKKLLAALAERARANATAHS